MVYTQLGAGIVLEHVDQINFRVWYFQLSLIYFIFNDPEVDHDWSQTQCFPVYTQKFQSFLGPQEGAVKDLGIKNFPLKLDW